MRKSHRAEYSLVSSRPNENIEPLADRNGNVSQQELALANLSKRRKGEVHTRVHWKAGSSKSSG